MAALCAVPRESVLGEGVPHLGNGPSQLLGRLSHGHERACFKRGSSLSDVTLCELCQDIRPFWSRAADPASSLTFVRYLSADLPKLCSWVPARRGKATGRPPHSSRLDPLFPPCFMGPALISVVKPELKTTTRTDLKAVMPLGIVWGFTQAFVPTDRTLIHGSVPHISAAVSTHGEVDVPIGGLKPCLQETV